ncbi:hypothetical protein BDZ89DRAFT_1169447 [Hymenopellis radicata]|nr:hypothetical protein BDZ89DRAFT_1169447 [Hymenopellis radicata]
MHPIDGGAAPILTFPTEILQTIFSFYHDASPFELRPKSKYLQLRLAHVCSRWRSAAFGIPSLWTKIQVSLQRYPSAASANGHALWSWWHAFNMFLSFAKNFPLMVEIVWYSGAQMVSEVRNISAALFRISPRWKAASLSFRTEIDWSFLHPLHAKLPLLEDLSFDVNEGAGGAPIVMRPCNAFSVVPSLRSVRLQSNNGGLPRLEIPWHQITRLSTRIPTAAISRFICNGVVTIGSSGDLKELSIRDPLNSRPTPPSSVVIPSLTRFSFEGGRYLVGSLILPALRELTVWDDMLRGSNKGVLVVDAARELICRSECTITVLNIEGYVPLTAQPLVDVAVHFHALTHLSILASGIHDPGHSQDAFRSILALLTPALSSFDTGDRNIFPSLGHLTLRREHTRSIGLNYLLVGRATADALCDMLELRYPSHSAPARVFTHATIIPGVSSPPEPLLRDFKRSAGWARITRVYQGQLDVLIQVFIRKDSLYNADFEMWLGRTDGGRSPYVRDGCGVR